MRQPTEKNAAIGKRLRTAREHKGLSQDTLAIRLKVTKGLVSQYESGLTGVPSKRFDQMATLLDVSAEWLLTGGEPDEQVKAQTKVEAEALSVLRTIPMEQQATIMAVMKAFAANVKKTP